MAPNSNQPHFNSTTESDVIIIGAGAAGLLCAIECAEKGLEVTILEKNAKPGMKILVSGGGRCNFTNLEAKAEHYISENPHFCKSALAKYQPEDFLERLSRRDLKWVEKKKHQLFSASGAKAILNCLIQDLKDLNGTLINNCEIIDVDSQNGMFHLKSDHQKWVCHHLVVATGGLSWPKLGISDFGYKVAQKFEHQLTRRSPGLVPFLWKQEDKKKYHHLSGLATQAKITHQQKSFEDDLLFTHVGLSGPLILQISSFWNKGEIVTIQWCTEETITQFFESDQKDHLQKYLSELHPKRWIKEFIPEKWLLKKNFQFSKLEKQSLIELLNNWKFIPHDTAGFGKAEVTLGGVNTNNISSKSMESQTRANLYFIGEVLDVTGQLGGFNFQWAWSSAAAAARNIAGF